MTILERLDSFLRDENTAIGKSVAWAPLGPEARAYLQRIDANEITRQWCYDLIAEYRLSQNFNGTIDQVLKCLLNEKEQMQQRGEFPSHEIADELYIDFIKLDYGSDVGVYVGFPNKGSEWFAYCLRMQCGGRAGTNVDSSKRVAVWRLGESRQLRRERYDSAVSKDTTTSARDLRKDRNRLLDFSAAKDAAVSSAFGVFTKGRSVKKANEERQWYDAVHRLIASALSGPPCFGVESLADSEVGYY